MKIFRRLFLKNFWLSNRISELISELISAIDSSKLYFEDQIFAIQGQNCKNKFRLNNRKKSLPLS